jgi:hypothetical protein
LGLRTLTPMSHPLQDVFHNTIQIDSFQRLHPMAIQPCIELRSLYQDFARDADRWQRSTGE